MSEAEIKAIVDRLADQVRGRVIAVMRSQR
jgi:hypothetical protein